MTSNFRILIVDCFTIEPRGKSFDNFFQSVSQALEKGNVYNPTLIKREWNDLTDYVVDWEHDRLHERCKACSKLFDTLDIIFIGGDVGFLPWDLSNCQVISLINMANKTNKPFFCGGSSALCAIFANSTQGRRYYVINGPEGGQVKELPNFPRYSLGLGVLGSGYLDNETGDLYSYDSKSKLWVPSCNVGLHLRSQKSIPFNGAPTNRTENLSSNVFSKIKLEKATFRNQMQSHPYIQLCLQNNPSALMYSPCCNWLLNDDGGLPCNTGLQVIADGMYGPVLLCQTNACIFVGEICDNVSKTVADLVLLGFVKDCVNKLSSVSSNHRIGQSLYKFLFGGEGGVAGGRPVGRYDSLLDKDSKPVLTALARAKIKTKLPHGPTSIDPPFLSMFVKNPSVGREADDELTFEMEGRAPPVSLAAHKFNTTMGKPIKPSAQNPRQKRTLRMNKLLETCGYSDMEAMCEHLEEARKREDPYGYGEAIPPHTRELLTPYMNTNSIGSRDRDRGGNKSLHEVIDNLVLIPEYISPTAAAGNNTSTTAISGVVLKDTIERPYEKGGPINVAGVTEFKVPVIIVKTSNKLAGMGQSLSPGQCSPINNNNTSNSKVYAQASYDINSGKIFASEKINNNNNKLKKNDDFMSNINIDGNGNVKKSLARPLSSNAMHRNISAQVIISNIISPPKPSHDKSHKDTNTNNDVNNNNKNKNVVSVGTTSVGDIHTKLATPLSNIIAKSMLPHLHPAYKDNSPHSPIQSPIPIIDLTSNTNKPYNTYKKFDLEKEKFKIKENEDGYEGVFTSGYKTAYEREVEEYLETKKKFLNGNFVNYFGVASELPLRQEGFIRPCAPYPSTLPHGGLYSNELTPADAALMRVNDKSKQLHGSWMV